ncbi:Ribosomal protein S5 domain 2-type fold, subgroup [Acididesulfobacillus acetoxydans]|uniref:endopeptidase La n=1 Tax=Acididesulfobacillus acetoxydans TaxID=1561005 RepID=A0A8S0WL26_9FIRM|nr:Lon family ATP-dependent protease [Acididesulfobacillus acetoxydans]CAA7599784.1 Ribosomal protein S5 domain 2-type fold, subgroup [Acididesulfobacillus acetoxydans]CEJ07350.1 spore_lon_C: ATP-dependent protease, Lon family [Acididesulfobacillus acetoxydans]
MKEILTKWLQGDASAADEAGLKREVEALYSFLAEFYGADRLVLKASKLDALALMRSPDLAERVAALEKIVSNDPVARLLPSQAQIPERLARIEDGIADLLARRSVEERLDRQIEDRMQERHKDYVQEIKMQVLKEAAGPENAQTLKKLGLLERMNRTRLGRCAAEVLRPQTVGEIIGQGQGVQSLLAKLATPYPQHILIYGPPGVGKTSAVRAALETVKGHANSPFAPNAPFVEADGTSLRWDPRDVTNPLLGSVHDPIFQGAKRDYAETGIPEPKPGLVTQAHGGVLFIDEIAEMDGLLLNKLLKVLEDKRVFFDSSYYDPADPNVPQFIKNLFEQGAPADFVLVGATTREPAALSPALRSRCSEVYFVPLEPEHVQKIVRQAAKKLDLDLEEDVAEVISEYVIEGRKATGILTDAYGLVRYRRPEAERARVRVEDVLEVLRSARLAPCVLRKSAPKQEVGRILGLGVAGFLGSVLEIEAIAFGGMAGKGTVRFNETAGSMARDSVFNATAVIRRITGADLRDYDVHVNVVGGGKIDGPSAGLAITLVLFSAIQDAPLRQDLAVTGEISIQGKVKPVGGIYEKIFGAKQAGVRTILIPADNLADVPGGIKGIEIIPVSDYEEAAKIAF